MLILLGIYDSKGEMTNEKTMQKIEWDNVILNCSNDFTSGLDNVHGMICEVIKVKAKDFYELTRITPEHYHEIVGQEVIQGFVQRNGKNIRNSLSFLPLKK